MVVWGESTSWVLGRGLSLFWGRPGLVPGQRPDSLTMWMALSHATLANVPSPCGPGWGNSVWLPAGAPCPKGGAEHQRPQAMPPHLLELASPLVHVRGLGCRCCLVILEGTLGSSPPNSLYLPLALQAPVPPLYWCARWALP